MAALIRKRFRLSSLPPLLLFLTLVLLDSAILVHASKRSWASLPLSYFNNDLNEHHSDSFILPRTQMTLGTPLQMLKLAVNFEESLFTAWSSDCAFCPVAGGTPFFPERSSTLKSKEDPWGDDPMIARGTWYEDVAGFGQLRARDVEFVLMEQLSIFYQGVRPYNGQLGLWTSSTAPRRTLLGHLWEQGVLLNPVVGLRLNPAGAKMTIGALNPEDYVGTINWVEVRGARARATPEGDGGTDEGWREDAFAIDGLKGYNGSFIPFDADEISATLSSFFRDLVVPNEVYSQYFSNPDYLGPTLSTDVWRETIVIDCPDIENSAPPPAPFTVTINGIDYPLVEADNWISATFTGNKCGIRISNYTTAMSDAKRTKPVADVELGLPLMRSVYIAYRFPTSDSPDCLPHIGFAFPSGMNHTTEQINQEPRSLPPLHDQCLSLTPPSGKPPSNISESESGRTSGAYRVYGDASGVRQVPLVAANELRRT
ncbi:hypothetical protein AX16_006425 [Volvariella volvacea WC 439]|nr:hypothetical protein AX16_006425 [Volvariella volvacea WC 439]